MAWICICFRISSFHFEFCCCRCVVWLRVFSEEAGGIWWSSGCRGGSCQPWPRPAEQSDGHKGRWGHRPLLRQQADTDAREVYQRRNRCGCFPLSSSPQRRELCFLREHLTFLGLHFHVFQCKLCGCGIICVIRLEKELHL